MFMLWMRSKRILLASATADNKISCDSEKSCGLQVLETSSIFGASRCSAQGDVVSVNLLIIQAASLLQERKDAFRELYRQDTSVSDTVLDIDFSIALAGLKEAATA
jgi:hypothetical protein